MSEDHRHGQDHDGHHHHGHDNDQGLKGMLRYLRWAPRMWRSPVNAAVVDAVAPQRGERVLDVGAGMGPAVVRAAKSGARVVAVEPTPFMRRVLSARRLGQRARSRIQVVDGTAEHLTVDDDSVDAIWAVNTMHHWVDVDAGVNEIVRALRPGGRFVLIDEDFNDPAHPEFERFGGTDADHGPEHHGFTMVDATSMGERFRAAGASQVTAAQREFAGRPSIAVVGEV